eukprot:Amastigsp_a515224_12.p3 type:complete len:179 gc:universal Amastigsp_a515224_12:851-315(-)
MAGSKTRHENTMSPKSMTPATCSPAPSLSSPSTRFQSLASLCSTLCGRAASSGATSSSNLWSTRCALSRRSGVGTASRNARSNGRLARSQRWSRCVAGTSNDAKLALIRPTNAPAEWSSACDGSRTLHSSGPSSQLKRRTRCTHCSPPDAVRVISPMCSVAAPASGTGAGHRTPELAR